MGKRDKDFKFMVGRPDSICSRTWSVKIRKNDVYIMNEMGKAHKISLHESGICHSAITKESAENFGMTPEQRRAVEWILKDDKINIAFAILFPHSQLRNRKNKNSTTNNILYIPIPPICSSVVLYVVKTHYTGNMQNVILDLDKGLHHLHSVQLASGDIITLLYFYTERFNSLIKEAEKRIYAFTAKNMPKPPLKVTSGFATVNDSDGIYYQVEVNLDNPSMMEEYRNIQSVELSNCFIRKDKL